MSYVNNPGGSGGGSLNTGSLDVTMPAHSDEVRGVVTGLSAAPLKVVAQAIYEESVVVQSGLTYVFSPTKLNASGFNWTLKVIGDEYWPGPGPVNIKINYIWSQT